MSVRIGKRQNVSDTSDNMNVNCGSYIAYSPGTISYSYLIRCKSTLECRVLKRIRKGGLCCYHTDTPDYQRVMTLLIADYHSYMV